MNRYGNTLLGYTALIAIVAVFMAVPALAGFWISGGNLINEVDPGQAIHHEMIVGIRETDSPMDVGAEVVGVGQPLDGGITGLDPEQDSSPYSAREFLSVTPTSFHLEPGDSQNLILEGVVPEDAEGGRYALVRICSSKENLGENVAVGVGSYVIVYLTISGTELIHTGEIESVTSEVSSDDPEKVHAYAIFKNTGNHHFRAMAKSVLNDEDGEVLGTVSTPPSEFSIVPTCSLQFDLTFDLEEEPPHGTYYVETTVSLEDGTVLDSDETELEL